MTDTAHTVELLTIADKSRAWPELRAIHDAAMRELVAMNAEAAKSWAEEQAKAKAEADAKAADVAVKAKAEAQSFEPAPRAIPSGDYAGPYVRDPAAPPTIERRL